MALSLILRSVNRAQAPLAQNILISSLSAKNTRSFSQIITKYNNKTTNINNLKLLTVTSMNRNFSVSEKRMSADHSKLWSIEKYLSISLLGIVPATLIVPNPVLDNLLAVVAVVHMHLGLEACVVDYIRPIIFGSVIPKLSLGLLYILSAATLAGLIQYNVNDIGIGKTFKKLWAIKE